MSQQPKQPFAYMDGLPSRDDTELKSLMDTVGGLPRSSVEEIVRNLYRAAIAHRRTGDPAYLTCLAEDALVTMRLRGDADSESALHEAPARPGVSEDAVDVEEMLARRGL